MQKQRIEIAHHRQDISLSEEVLEAIFSIAPNARAGWQAATLFIFYYACGQWSGGNVVEMTVEDTANQLGIGVNRIRKLRKLLKRADLLWEGRLRDGNGQVGGVIIKVNPHPTHGANPPSQFREGGGIYNNILNKYKNNITPKPSAMRSAPTSKPKKTHRAKKKVSMRYRRFAKMFLEQQAERFPKMVKDTSTAKANVGGEEFRKLVELDGHEWEDVKKVVQWGLAHQAFWSRQLLSPCGLRNKGRNGQTKFINLLNSYEAENGGISTAAGELDLSLLSSAEQDLYHATTAAMDGIGGGDFERVVQELREVWDGFPGSSKNSEIGGGGYSVKFIYQTFDGFLEALAGFVLTRNSPQALAWVRPSGGTFKSFLVREQNRTGIDFKTGKPI